MSGGLLLFNTAPLFTAYKMITTQDAIGGQVIDETIPDFTFQGHMDLLSSEPQGDRPFTGNKAYIPNATHVILIDYRHKKRFKDQIKMRLTDEEGRSYRVLYTDNPVNMGIILEVYVKMEG